MRKREVDKGKYSGNKNTNANRKSCSKKEREISNKKNSNPKGKKQNEPKKKSKIGRFIKGLLIVLITILVIFMSIFTKYLIQSGGNVKTAIKKMFKDIVGDQEPIFVLVMGVSEDISAKLTDTIMLIGYNPDNNQAFVLSIPRDTFVGDNESRAGGFDKINALYQKSPQKTVDAAQKLTGIRISYYVTVRTSVLVKIVDTIGGIDFDVPINMDYDDPSQNLHIHLKAGPQKINGEKAEQLVRFRHNNNGTTYKPSYGDNDEGRTRTQREFLKVVMEKVISIRDIDKIKTISKEIFDNLETDITLEKIFGYIPYAMDFNTENLAMEQLPGKTEILNNLWFFKADKVKTKELINGYIEKLGLTEDEKCKYLIDYGTSSSSEEKNNTTTQKKSATTTENSTNKGTKNTQTTNKTTSNTNKTKQ